MYLWEAHPQRSLQLEYPGTLTCENTMEVHHYLNMCSISVEWSCFDSFSPLVGEQILDDPRYMYYEIPNLVQGNAYYVRVCAWNIKGFGPTTTSNPPYAIPTSKLIFFLLDIIIWSLLKIVRYFYT